MFLELHSLFMISNIRVKSESGHCEHGLGLLHVTLWLALLANRKT